MLYSKLKNVKSTINIQEYYRERLILEKYIVNIMEYKYKNYPPTKTFINDRSL